MSIVKKTTTTAAATATFSPPADYASEVCLQSSINKRGYAIPKSALYEDDYLFLKQDLTVQPNTQSFGIGVSGGSDPFPVYRENDYKIYIPRFYGIQRYGLPAKNELSCGDSIDVPFVKSLRDYQNEIVHTYVNHVQSSNGNGGGGGGILEVPCGQGKCLAKDTLVRMYNNDTKPVQDIVVGDQLMGDDETPRNVLSLARGREIMYKITDKYTKLSYSVNKSHILSLKSIVTGILYDLDVISYLKHELIHELYGYRIPHAKYCNHQCKKRQLPLIYPLEVEQLEEDDYYGFEIDGNRRFVLYEYSVTHNTVMALKIGSILSKKMLILVHKEFLMNQWIERIQEFLPNARVGKIQGTKTEIEDKDIVIGMIQTMYNRSFQDGTFASFGLTIIDEVHRIGSEEFSKTLLKTITPYMLGISATVERKDGLTKILYMFIGKKIYSGSRKDKDEVCVYGIDYISNDEEFDETEVDWKGNTKYSTMITKICDYGPRSQFIVTLLKDLMDYAKEHRPQIMVLSHNKSLLNYLHDAIQHGGFASVGYYVGGMKESALKITAEEKQVVLATYAMAAEALDIKTLSILIMATPKTDIEQSVGRILREKHAQPMVVDIIDSHSTFQNQWRKRKTFYRKNNYKILHCRSDKFKGFANTLWNTSFDPNQKKRGEKPCISLEQHEEDEEHNVSSLATSSKGCLLKWQE